MVKQLVIGLTALAGLSYFIKKKVDNWRSILPQLKAFPTEFNSLKFDEKFVNFVIDVTIFNPTKEIFNPDGIVAMLDRLIVVYKGKELATVIVKQNGIKIPAEGKYVLKNLKVQLPYTSLLLVKSIPSADDLDCKAVINILGEEYTI